MNTETYLFQVPPTSSCATSKPCDLTRSINGSEVVVMTTSIKPQQTLSQRHLKLLSTAPPCQIVAVTVETTPLPTSSMTTKTTTVAGMVHNAIFALCLKICHWPHRSDIKKTEHMARSTNFGGPGDIGSNTPFDMFILACVFPFSWKNFRKEWIDLNAIPEYNQSLQQRDWGSFI